MVSDEGLMMMKSLSNRCQKKEEQLLIDSLAPQLLVLVKVMASLKSINQNPLSKLRNLFLFGFLICG